MSNYLYLPNGNKRVMVGAIFAAVVLGTFVAVVVEDIVLILL